VSRETRQLLATALLAVVALWVLARVRYPDRPATPNPVPALLTQFTGRPTLGDLAAEGIQLRSRLGASLLAIPSGGSFAAAFRIRDDTAIALLPPDARNRMTGASPPGTGLTTREEDVIAADAATGLTIVRVPAAAPALAPPVWNPRDLDEPRYLMSTVVSPDAVALRPAFVAALRPVTSPGWSAPIWSVPVLPDLQTGSLVFTSDAELAGLVVRHGDGLAIVPAATLLADAYRLRQAPPRPPGYLGVEVQPLTPALAAATGGRTGVVLAWVDPRGPAAGHLMPGDVVEAVEGRWLDTRAHWDVRVARLAAGDRIVLGVRRAGEWRDVQFAAAQRPATPLRLGLSLRRVANAGSEVLGVDRPSAGDAAGLERGDVITLIGAVAAPTPAQIRDAFEAATERQPVLIAISRGTSSRVATLHR
jgi:hypothetical protein